MTATQQDADQERFISYLDQMAHERGEFIMGERETMADHYRYCVGCSFCFPESIERESDI